MKLGRLAPGRRRLRAFRLLQHAMARRPNTWYSIVMKLACVGNALVDILARVDTDFSASLGIHPGSTEHVDRASMDLIISRLSDYTMTAGGGAANTARIFRALGGSASFVGAVGQDAYGDLYALEMEHARVEIHLQRQSIPSGIFCSLKDAAGRRSIIVNPGAAPLLDINSIPDGFFAPGAVLYLDGFLAMAPDLLEGLISSRRRQPA